MVPLLEMGDGHTHGPSRVPTAQPSAIECRDGGCVRHVLILYPPLSSSSVMVIQPKQRGQHQHQCQAAMTAGNGVDVGSSSSKRRMDSKSGGVISNEKEDAMSSSLSLGKEDQSKMMESIIHMEKKLWKKSHSWGDQFMKQIGKPRTHLFCMCSFCSEGHQKVLGYAIVSLQSLVGNLAKLMIAPECRGRGLGRTLLDACVQFVRARSSTCGCIMLFVETTNDKALRLYQHAGFVIENTVYDYYDVGSHAHRMKLELQPAEL